MSKKDLKGRDIYDLKAKKKIIKLNISFDGDIENATEYKIELSPLKKMKIVKILKTLNLESTANYEDVAKEMSKLSAIVLEQKALDILEILIDDELLLANLLYAEDGEVAQEIIQKILIEVF